MAPFDEIRIDQTNLTHESVRIFMGMADVKVTVEILQPHVDAMHPNGKCVASFVTQQFA